MLTNTHLWLRKWFPTVSSYEWRQSKVQVRCLFHNDHNPSAVLWTQEDNQVVMWCSSCNRNFSFIAMFGKYYHLGEERATELWKYVRVAPLYRPELVLGEARTKRCVEEYHFNPRVIEQVGLYHRGDKSLFSVPVRFEHVVVDTLRYDPQSFPKWKGATNSKKGFVVPALLWNPTRPTLVCAGEKDMLIARSKGLNAICITGGEHSLPRWQTADFQRCPLVVIVYDNDAAGKEGSQNLAAYLLRNGVRYVRVVDISGVCRKPKEDLWDFFVKYQRTTADLKQLVANTRQFVVVKKSNGSTTVRKVRLVEAQRSSNHHHLLQSKVLINSETVTVQQVPSVIHYNVSFKQKVTQKKWFFKPHQHPEMLFTLLQPVSVRDKQLKMFLARKEPNKSNVSVYKTEQPLTVYRYNTRNVVPMFADTSGITVNFTTYSFNKLTPGQEYELTYHAVPNQYVKNNPHVIELVVHKATMLAKQYQLYTPSEHNHKLLEQFRQLTHNELFTHFRSYATNYASELLWLTVDLTFHSVLKFNYYGKTERGVVYTSIIGDTRVGKSETVRDACRHYQAGVVVNSANATPLSLVGGSEKVGGSWQITTGLLPVHHNGLVALEEAEHLGDDYYDKMLQVKVEGKAEVYRVGQSSVMPCFLRLFEIANPRPERLGEGTKPIAEYNHGPDVVRSIMKQDATISRQDIILLLTETTFVARDYVPPTTTPVLNQEAHQVRLCWVWSRQASDIVFKPETLKVIKEVHQSLCKRASTPTFKIFNRETDRRIARLSVAYAAIRVSTDPTYTQVIVLPEHVTAVQKFVEGLYFTDPFNMDAYIKNEQFTQHFTKTDEKVFQTMLNAWKQKWQEHETSEKEVVDPHIRYTRFIQYLRFQMKPQTDINTIRDESVLFPSETTTAIDDLKTGGYLTVKNRLYTKTPKLNKAFVWLSRQKGNSA